MADGRFLKWFQQRDSGPGDQALKWRCAPRTTPPCRRYSMPRQWLANAERQMRGTDTDTLQFKREEDARRLVWC